MKYTNIKKLLIKFMGGGLINFPTRFLRWIKIDGDAEGDNSGGGGDGGNTPSGDIGYEEIYQFYKKEAIKELPQEILDNSVIPETFNDIESGTGQAYETGKIGIWHCYESDIQNILSTAKILFTTFEDRCIYVGEYLNN